MSIRMVYHVPVEQINAANDAAVAIVGEDSGRNTFSVAKLVPSERPGGLGPSSHIVCGWLMEDGERMKFEAELTNRGVDFVAFEDLRGPDLAGSVAIVHAELEKAGLATQKVTAESLATMPAEDLEALIATMDAKAIEDGVAAWIKDGIAARDDKVTITAEVDAKTAEIEATKEPPPAEPIKEPAPTPPKT